MKRIIMLLVGISMLVLPAAVSANYPMYLNGDRNFIRCDGHMGTAWYVDRTSLVVQKYEPSQYIIAVNVLTARSAIGNEDDFYSGGSGTVTDGLVLSAAGRFVGGDGNHDAGGRDRVLSRLSDEVLWTQTAV